MRLLVTDAAAQPPRQATAWLIMTLGRKVMKTLLALLVLPLACFAAEPKYTALRHDRTSSADLRKLESLVLPEIKVSEVSLARLLAVISSSDEAFPQLNIIRNSSELGDRKITLNVQNQNYALLCDIIAIQADAIWWIDGTVNFETKKNEK